MSIEKMTFFDIRGPAEALDEALCRLARSRVFHLESAAKLAGFSFGTAAFLRNPYGALLVKLMEISGQLNIPLRYVEDADTLLSQADRSVFIDSAHAYLNKMREEYPRYFSRKNTISDEIASYTAALNLLSHVKGEDLNFDALWESKFLKIRFGRLPAANAGKAIPQADRLFALYPLDSDMGYIWCFYVTVQDFCNDVDELFLSLGFERLRIPDYVHGTPKDALAFIREGLEQEMREAEQASKDIDVFVRREQDKIMALYTRVKFLHDAFDLRKYAVSLHDTFQLVGFVPQKDADNFTGSLREMPELVVECGDPDPHGPLKPPVRLRNNWFVKPFEMFVEMYGLPSYNDIDPSPFVAYTYALLFGIMFGDVGQGALILLLGMYLRRKKGMALGGIMSRIGISSALFGTLYGSVFGFEHALDWFYIGLLKLHEKPVEVMHPGTTNYLLVAAIGMGAAIILTVILFNIRTGFKHRDWERILLSHNGFAGLIFYASVLAAVVARVLGYNLLVAPYIACFFVAPLVVIFFREPLAKLLRFHLTDSFILSNQELKRTVTFQRGALDIRELFTAQFMTARFGRLPTDSYEKLAFYSGEPFMVYPLKSDRDYIWLIYGTVETEKEHIDAIFQGLYFERMYIPPEDVLTNELAESFIIRCIEEGANPMPDAPGEVKSKRKTMLDRVFPDGIAAFFAESFFELFEVVLSYVTNTMSFLRVGGFILSHAGMMSVVMTLSQMVGSGANLAVIVLGNLFVMVLEGLIVGIQCLRLEFYEMFSRFFDASGDAFSPVVIHYQPRSG